jgi:hypothetical protein
MAKHKGRIYGLKEFAEAANIDYHLFKQWRLRDITPSQSPLKKTDRLPPPTDELSLGPVWSRPVVKAFVEGLHAEETK